VPIPLQAIRRCGANDAGANHADGLAAFAHRFAPESDVAQKPQDAGMIGCFKKLLR
jgi:hypothetical protein